MRELWEAIEQDLAAWLLGVLLGERDSATA